jgi:hypothetical protein
MSTERFSQVKVPENNVLTSERIMAILAAFASRYTYPLIPDRKAMKSNDVDTLTRMPMESGENKPVKYFINSRTQEGNRSAGPFEADPNNNLTSKIIDLIGNNSIDTVTVLKVSVKGVNVNVVVDPSLLPNTNVAEIKEALANPNYPNSGNKKLKELVSNVRYQVKMFSDVLELMPVTGVNTQSKFVFAITDEGVPGTAGTNLTVSVGDKDAVPVSIIVINIANPY